MKKARRILSLVLVFALLVSVMSPMAAYAEEASSNSGRVAVGVATGSGSMNLTEVGSSDWMHITHTTINRKAVPTDPLPEGVEVIDYLSTNGTTGRTFGQTADQVWRFQTFVPSVSGPMTSLEVALIKKGTPSDLVARLYKVTDTVAMTVELLAETTVASDAITSNTALALDFGEIDVEAGTYYAVALSQTTLDNSNLYHWCNSSNPQINGKITDAEGTVWKIENTAASLRVIVGEYTIPEAEAVGILDFEVVGATTLASSMSDSAVAYSWSDGMPDSSVSGYRYGGVLSYKNGEHSGEISEEAGWKITVPAAETVQTLTFVSGVWEASAEIYIYANGDTANPVYSNTELTASGNSKLLTYTVTIFPDTEVEVYGRMVNKTNVWGNMSIGGIALAIEEPAAPSVNVDVAVASGTMNLTEVGTTDWLHLVGSDNGPVENRKVVPDDSVPAYEVIDYMNASNSNGRTFGSVSDQVKRYQTFVPSVSGPLNGLEVAVIKKGSPSALVATLVKMEDKSELANVTIPADQITDNTAFDLGFENVTLEAGVSYAVVLTQETLAETDRTNIYWWCAASTPFDNGKIKEDGSWMNENTAASIRVTIGEPVVRQTVDIIQFETVGPMVMNTSFGDSAVAYSWTDGYPTVSKSGYTSGGVMNYQAGSYTGDVTEEAGWKLTIPESDYIQTLTFVSGVWQATTEIYIYINGDTENPVYHNAELTAADTSKLLKYTVTVSPNTSIEVYGKLTNKGHAWGNVTMSGIALSEKPLDASENYIELLRQAVQTAEAWLNEDIDQYFIDQLTNALESARAALEDPNLTQSEAYGEYVFLNAAIEAVENAQSSASFADSYASGMVSSFGWEGDMHAPIAYIDGTYRLRDNGNTTVTFGVTGLAADSVSWYNAEGYLPCFVSEYEKNGLQHKVENFADLVIIDGNKYEIAYSRMTTTNTTEETKLLPKVSESLVALNDDAANTKSLAAGETVVRDYCIGADRFGGTYAYPSNAVLAEQGSWDEHYENMKEYWNTRLEAVVNIESIPETYSELIDAYKAGYIYMLIISDGYELHVGENGYDRVFDHDVIGMLASLIMSGHTEHFADYAQYILMNVQYPDARWKYSWPFALYLQKTGDFDTILTYWSDLQSNTHNIADSREICETYPNLLDVDGNPARVMKRTDAIDSYGYWVIDNWAGLFGLTTYAYICDALYAEYGDELYKTEYDWAKAEYDSLLKSTEAVLTETMEAYDFNYIPISMIVPNELSARANVQDGNWAAHYLFGRWNWDGYLFGADQDSWLLDLTDTTYDYIIDAKSAVFDSPYNMGGYPHGYFSSAYNAGYYSAALSGEKWRDGGIEAYLWMVNNAMGGPFGWWEGIAYPSETTNLWDRTTSNGGGGSSQHMWGQSTATKVLIDSFLAEKGDGTIIAGRGLPLEFNADGETIVISNYLCNGGKYIGFEMTTSGNTITFTLTGDTLDNAVSLELLATVNNIASVSEGCTYNTTTGVVTIPAGVTSVTIEMAASIDEKLEVDDAAAKLEKALSAASNVKGELYVTATVDALNEAVANGQTALEGRAVEEMLAAAESINDAIEALVELKTYVVAFDYLTDVSAIKTPSFGELTDERYRYGTFKTGGETIVFDKLDVILGNDGGTLDDALISFYTLGEDNYTLAECIGTARLEAEEVAGGLNTFYFTEEITLSANTYYAIHFAMDNSNGIYGSYTYESGALMSDDLYAVKIQGNGNVVDESFLGTPKMRMYSDNTDKTALNEAVVNAVSVPQDILDQAMAVLLNREATQAEINAALEALNNVPEVTVIAEGWSGYTTWTLTDNGVLTFTPSAQTYEGKVNMRNYWKVDGVLTLPWGEYANQITTVVVEEGINAVGQMAFYGLPNLTSVSLPSTLTEIRNYAFKGCTGLSEINLPEGLLTIGEGSFYGCSALTAVVIPASVTEIGEYAYAGCTGLETVTILGAPVIGENAFKGVEAYNPGN